MKLLCIDREKCSGCGACQALCSLGKRGQVRPAEGRIRIRRAAGVPGRYAVYCQHCADPECVKACLKTIIRKENGLVLRDFQGCFACSACEVSCPVGAVVYDSGLDAYMTCDLCGGDPLCVKVCPTGALQFLEASEASAARRGAYAGKKQSGGGAGYEHDPLCAD